MAKKYYQDKYYPKNPDKYIGKHTPIYRSGWEKKFMEMCDTHPGILAWGSETHRIPYIHPLTGKHTHYVPDFFMIYEDANGVKHAEMVEVKPLKQTAGNARSVHDKAHAIVNEVKWEMARAWCAQQGIGFKIVTENDIFRSPTKKSRKKR